MPDIPDDLPGGEFADHLHDLLPLVQAYFIAFAVIGLFWYGHHKAWSRFERSSSRLVVANLLLLALIGLMPFTTALLGQYGEQPLSTAIYALNVGLASLADSWMDRVAIHQKLAPPLSEADRRELFIGGWLRVSIFFVSIPVAWLSIGVAQLTWLALFAVRPVAQAIAERSRLTVR